ncbi:conserved hypothetical protein [Paenibacillus curdlanolyticus YK9]|uniref:Uncharacterized protein n=1 Tax=Paenibacillus curdlanolyticus YK9 TaxID=717606 RepID=E0IF02_9BACL|nr:hypothetical protein [Paenibacillus curdlanolyticus]EFM08778.1 conserved hypothetical protein [Paenibacillus curdlanolyticus YK9]
MSYQEKKHIVSLFSSILIFGSYCFYVYLRYHDAVMEGTELFRFWGAVILILIPVTIVAKIIIEIIFVIINRIATNEAAPAFADELDKQIELRAMRFSYLVFVFGFLLAMGSLVLEMKISVMFIILILSGFLSEVAGIGLRLYLYRKGV